MWEIFLYPCMHTSFSLYISYNYLIIFTLLTARRNFQTREVHQVWRNLQTLRTHLLWKNKYQMKRKMERKKKSWSGELVYPRKHLRYSINIFTRYFSSFWNVSLLVFDSPTVEEKLLDCAYSVQYVFFCRSAGEEQWLKPIRSLSLPPRPMRRLLQSPQHQMLLS